MKLQYRTMAVCALAAVMWASVVVQNSAQERDREREEPRREGSAGGGADQQIATWAALGDHAEIVLGQRASQEASTAQVRKFAEMMVADHTKSLNTLREFGAKVAVPRKVAKAEKQPEDERGAAREESDQPRRKPAAAEDRDRRTASGGSVDLLNVKQEICDRVLAVTLKDLQSKEGIEFDQCYIFQQVMAHTEQLETIQVLSEQASPDLRQALQKEAATVKKHLQQAQQLAKSLDKEPRTAEADKP